MVLIAVSKLTCRSLLEEETNILLPYERRTAKQLHDPKKFS
jgi:hypothetical protein